MYTHGMFCTGILNIYQWGGRGQGIGWPLLDIIYNDSRQSSISITVSKLKYITQANAKLIKLYKRVEVRKSFMLLNKNVCEGNPVTLIWQILAVYTKFLTWNYAQKINYRLQVGNCCNPTFYTTLFLSWKNISRLCFSNNHFRLQPHSQILPGNQLTRLVISHTSMWPKVK